MHRNILALWLGVLISTKRKELGLTVEYFAGQIGDLQASYLRMIENGLAAFSVGKAVSVMDALNRLLDTSIVYGRFAEFLVTSHSLPKTTNPNDLDNLKNFLIGARDYDENLSELIHPVLHSQIWDVYSKNNPDYDLLKKKLGSPNYLQTLTRFLEGNINKETSSIYIERFHEIYKQFPSALNWKFDQILENLSDELDVLNSVNTSYSLPDWERTNHIKKNKRFGAGIKNMWVAVDSIHQIIEFEESLTFSWQFVFEDVFESFTCLIKEQSPNEDELYIKQLLTDFFRKNAKKYNSQNAVDDFLKDKFKFRLISDFHFEDIHQLALQKKETPKVFEWWLYELINLELTGFYYPYRVDEGLSNKVQEIDMTMTSQYQSISNSNVQDILKKIKTYE